MGIIRPNIYAREKNLASIKLAVASGKENVKFSINHIPIENATDLYQHALKTKE
ncbi:hypothetical protein QKW52_17090 [Bacillus sonorensis]|nr:hypothetical protein [Bacillus sonorensis]